MTYWKCLLCAVCILLPLCFAAGCAAFPKADDPPEPPQETVDTPAEPDIPVVPAPEPEPEPDCSDEGQPKIKRQPDGSWKCMFCDHMNPSGKDYCQKCGAEAFFDQP